MVVAGSSASGDSIQDQTAQLTMGFLQLFYKVLNLEHADLVESANVENKIRFLGQEKGIGEKAHRRRIQNDDIELRFQGFH